MLRGMREESCLPEDLRVGKSISTHELLNRITKTTSNFQNAGQPGDENGGLAKVLSLVQISIEVDI